MTTRVMPTGLQTCMIQSKFEKAGLDPQTFDPSLIDSTLTYPENEENLQKQFPFNFQNREMSKRAIACAESEVHESNSVGKEQYVKQPILSETKMTLPPQQLAEKTSLLDFVQSTDLELWDEIRGFCVKNVKLWNEKEYDVLTGWILLTWIPELWDYYAYIWAFGLKKTGKTRIQEILELLTMNPKRAGSMTKGAIQRILNEGFKTLIVDEFTLKERSDVLKILNEGYRKNGVVVLCETKKGGKWTPETFKVGGFKCFAGTYGIPETLASRSIQIRTRKSTERYRIEKEDEKWAERIVRQLSEWREKVMEIEAENPDFEIPKEIDDFIFETSGKDGRLTDMFAPLYIVAPEQRKEILVEYLKELGEYELQQELASWEAEVFTAILKVYHRQSGGKTWFSTQEVTDAVNEERPDTEKVTRRKVGSQIRIFGFTPKSSGQRRGYEWDESIIKNLKERYPIDESDLT